MNEFEKMNTRFLNYYESGTTPPWDAGIPDNGLIETIKNEKISPCGVLDIGCGTGTNTIWLAEQGFLATGIDLSEIAIEKARAKVREVSSSITGQCIFHVNNFFSDEVPEAPYEFVFDRGFFHTYEGESLRKEVAEKISRLIKPGGHWLTLMGSKDGPEREVGPPRRSVFDIAQACEPLFEIIKIQASYLTSSDRNPARSWICYMKKRKH